MQSATLGSRVNARLDGAPELLLPVSGYWTPGFIVKILNPTTVQVQVDAPLNGVNIFTLHTTNLTLA